MIHYFKNNINNIQLPEKFTYPFNYTPHKLCILAADEVKNYLNSLSQFPEDIHKGKMFGVLIVKLSNGDIGYLAAYSGNINSEEIKSFFVPPVYDLLSPTSFFKNEEVKISNLNNKIFALENDEDFLSIKSKFERIKADNERLINIEKNKLKENKKIRDNIRNSSILDAELESRLIKESQFQKAEFKRLSKIITEREEKLVEAIKIKEDEIATLKEKRKIDSEILQKRLFSEFKFLNALGEEKDLWSIFEETPSKTPPAGSGECAAPKLLQYAYLSLLYPIAMAEFWLGESPQGEIRHEGFFYPACIGKCKPILTHMLEGLVVDENPESSTIENIEILYEDEYMLAVNKPSGMLSVPGKKEKESVESIVKKMHPEISGPAIVHRLDMSTSGIMLIAKDKEVHKILQLKFISRDIKKRYIALLEGTIDKKDGIIKLPISPDYYDRPRQKVDYESGKIAITRYKVLEEKSIGTKTVTKVELCPLTGRTHQLRVHCAHKDGLGTPILGDELYGSKDERLYLHADKIEFKHPISQKLMIIEKKEDF